MIGLFDQLRELWDERRRVGLVALGVLWGSLGLTLLVTFGLEFRSATSATMIRVGDDLLRFYAGATTRPFAGLPSGRPIRLVPEDGPAVAAAVPEVRGVSVEYSSGPSTPVRRGEIAFDARLVGVEASFGALRVQIPEPFGRFLSETDVVEHRRVAFLGDRIRDQLFGSDPAVGETFDIFGVPFTVVGVLERKITGSSYNGREEDKIVIPATTYRDLTGRRTLSYLVVGLREEDDDARAIDAIYRVLGARHRFDPDDRDALGMTNYVEFERMVGTMVDGNNVLTFLVGVLGLLVSVIGVANVMYVMVEERTREIGVMMALGARPWTIASQRILEGLLVTLAGGVAGLALCEGLFAILDRIPLDPHARAYLGYPRLSWPVALTVVSLLGLTGTLAGWVPARRAASLDPVEALREE
ncbi:MAG: ABC transporter permease [bacterium]|nr:ABC transporter permease [bacterium]